MRKKLLSRKGETLTETLVAVLIIVLSLTMLAGAIVTAARVNHQADTLNTAFTLGTYSGNQNVVIERSSGNTTVSVRQYQSGVSDDNANNDYTYYVR